MATAGWQNFKHVTAHISPSHRLFRASSPNYAGNDQTQQLRPEDVQFLVQSEIHGVISFNKYPYSEKERKLLSEANIGYLHLPVQDYTAPTVEQLDKASEYFNDSGRKSTLVHCGAGFGRSGTAVTALQLHATQGKQPPEAEWGQVNHVETDAQLAILRVLRDRLRQ